MLLVGLPIGLAIYQALAGGSDESAADRLRADRAGSVSLGRFPSPLLPSRVPESYRISYRVADTATDVGDMTTEEVKVRRPFDARIVVRDANADAGNVRTERLTVLTTLAAKSSDGRWTAFSIGPNLATSDLRFGPALDQAIEEGDIEVRERRRVLGRECQVFRAGSTLAAGILTPYERGARDFADVCVDEAGLVVEEVWTLDGKRVQRRVAVEVDEDVAFDDDDPAFRLPANVSRVSAASGGGSARKLAEGSLPPGAFWDVGAGGLPEGFSPLGRWAVVTPNIEVMRDPTQASVPKTASSVSSVWVRGADLLVVDQGVVSGSAGLPSPTTSRPVDLGGLGLGEAFTDFRTNEVRVSTGRAGEFVRIYGTLPLPLLVEVARAMTVVPGNELRYADDADA